MNDALRLVEQRADYTFKYNRSIGRHGWLRLTPAYSVKLVEQVLATATKAHVVLDPFAGTGTTVLAAAERGHVAYGCDINPFLIWLGNVKCRNYTETYLDSVRRRVSALAKRVKKLQKHDHWIPPIFNIERWWHPQTLSALGALRAALVEEFGEAKEDKNDGLAWVAFARLAVETSAAAFNHVSMSFHDRAVHYEAETLVKLYLSVLDFILSSAQTHISGSGQIVYADSRDQVSLQDRIDTVVTSPPYPNRISYIRELRPYMYWTRFLNEAPEAGEMDWTAIGGTWGIATSRLTTWKTARRDLPTMLSRTVKAIANSESKNGRLLATYVHKYFSDIHDHLGALRETLVNGARLYYIVGNSSFYGNLVHTEKLYSESLRLLGYADIQASVIRKRNSNKALFEFVVSASWPG